MNQTVATLLVACGGAIGAVLRFWSGLVAISLFGNALPFATLFVNAVGGFVIGFIAGGSWGGPGLRLFLMVGILGGFTTFSSFSLETMRLVQSGRELIAAGYVVSSLVLSIGGAAAGLWLGRSMP